MSQSILLHGHSAGPNPWKVMLLLEELNVPYEHKPWDFADLKTSAYEKLNPNGRTPTIQDPNTGITLWESGAIIEYLIETYDKSKEFTYTTSPEKYHLKQWLHFQMSGQGPYFGQNYWFNHYHPEDVQSAKDRYGNEVKRVVSVIDRHLSAAGTSYLVGEKYTYADMAFIPWFDIAYEEKWLVEDDSHFCKWYKRISQRPISSKLMDARRAD